MVKRLAGIVSTFALLGLTHGVLNAAEPTPAAAPATTVVKGVSAASERRDLNFVNPGLISEVLVHEGDAVKAGQELMRQDDAMEKQRLVGLTREADQSLVVSAKRKQQEYKEAVFKRKQEAYANNAASESEVREARLDAELAAIEVQLAQRDQSIKEAERDLQALKIKQMTLKCPVNGFVVKIDRHEGEIVDMQRSVTTIVTTDPLYIEVKQASKGIVDKFNVGQEMEVRFPQEDGWQKAKIKYIAPEADARAGMLMFRLELSNPAGRRPGDEVDVRLPSSLAQGN